MKTKNQINLNGGWDNARLFLLTVFLLLTGTMSVQAYDYDLWVGGVRVTTDNSDNVTGGGIQSGTVKYNRDSRILVLTDVKIYVNSTSGNGQYAIYNKGIDGLLVRFNGTNEITAVNGAAMMCNCNTDIGVGSGRTDIFGYNAGSIYINGEYKCYIQTWPDTQLFITGDNCSAIESKNSDGTVIFGGENIEVEGNKGNLVNLISVEFKDYNGYGCDITLVRTADSSYPSVKNVYSMPNCNYSTAYSNSPVIVSPSMAEYNLSKKSICYSNGTPIYNDDIVINTDFVCPVSNKVFPDAAFRSYLVNRFGPVITQEERDNCTVMELPKKGNIASVEGIKYFSELQTFRCIDNKLTTLDLSTNIKLIGVECDYNQLTSLSVAFENLQWLTCSNNKLTSCLSYPQYSFLKDIDCSNNPNMTSLGVEFNKLPALERFDCSGTKFSTLNLSDCKKLKELTCNDMPALTELECNFSALTQLSVSGCSNLKKLDCFFNKLTWLDVYGCSSLQELICGANALTAISNLSSCKSSLQELSCHSNKFSSLDFSGFSQLQILNCGNDSQLTSLTGLSGNTALSELKCDGCSLTSLDVTGCSNLTTLVCYGNKFHDLYLSDLPNLQKLDCSRNSSLTYLDLSNVPSLAEVDCSRCDLRSLDWYDLKLSTLNCSYNQNLTLLNNSRDYNNPGRALTSLNVTECSSLNTLKLRDNDELATLDLTGCYRLQYLDVTYNKLTTLDLTPCPNLISVSCRHNNLTSIDLSNNSNIQYVYCGHNNNLSSLNVKNYAQLIELGCDHCQLQQLDLRGCRSLSFVACNNNQINTLMLPQESSALYEVDCYNNRLEDVTMDLVVQTLPNRTGKTTGKLYALTDDAYNEHNTCSSQNVSNAKSKNWDVYAQTSGFWNLYEGSSIPTNIRTADADVDDNAPRYNMSGQRVGRDYKGIVIKNGRKVVR